MEISFKWIWIKLQLRYLIFNYIISLSLICHGENPEIAPHEPILIINSGSFSLLISKKINNNFPFLIIFRRISVNSLCLPYNSPSIKFLFISSDFIFFAFKSWDKFLHVWTRSSFPICLCDRKFKVGLSSDILLLLSFSW